MDHSIIRKPTHSRLILFASAQMSDITQRRETYKRIEERRKRPLIVYATSTRPNVPAMMAGDAVPEFIDQIDAIDRPQVAVDVMVLSSGGDARRLGATIARAQRSCPSSRR